MKNQTLLSLTLLMSFFVFMSCNHDGSCIRGIGPSVTETINLANFSGIDLSLDARVIISEGSSQEVQITGEKNIIDLLDRDISGGIWKINIPGTCHRDYDLTINITIPELTEVTVTGSGDVRINDFSSPTDLRFEISGSSKIVMNQFIIDKEFDVNITGSGVVECNAEVSGVDELDIRISGSGEFSGFEVLSDVCNVHVSGAGDCMIPCK